VEIANGLRVGDRVVAVGHGGLYAGARVSEVAGGPAERPESRESEAAGGTPPAAGKQPAKTKEGGHGGH